MVVAAQWSMVVVIRFNPFPHPFVKRLHVLAAAEEYVYIVLAKSVFMGLWWPTLLRLEAFDCPAATNFN